MLLVFTERVLQVAKNTWSYVAATAIVVGLAGGGWLLSKDNSQPVIAQPVAVEKKGRLENQLIQTQIAQAESLRKILSLTAFELPIQNLKSKID